ncbi:DUF2147 domain-containing protein [Frankia sp. RB7]|nr:DUF2147 domain-containing protein [Frankia sp. RB7]
MKRLSILFGTLIALTAIAPTAQASTYAFTIGGHRFQVEAPRNCRSASCVSISTGRSIRPIEDVATTQAPLPAPVPVVIPPVQAATPVKPPQATVVAPPPAPMAPIVAAASSRPVTLPPAPRPETPKFEALSPNPPRVDLSRADPPRTEPPVVAPRPEVKQTAGIAPRGNDEPAYLPLGEWENDSAKGTVRIERCGPLLCGFALTEPSTRGESVLVNMKPKAHDAWSGSIYSGSSGKTYYATMTLKSWGKLYVETCAFGHFWCSGNDWTRVEEGPRS